MDDEDHRLIRRSLPSNGELLHLIFDSASDFAIVTTDPDGLITSWNRGAERLLGWLGSEAVGRDSAMIFTDEQRARGAPREERDSALTPRASGGRTLAPPQGRLAVLGFWPDDAACRQGYGLR